VLAGCVLSMLHCACWGVASCPGCLGKVRVVTYTWCVTNVWWRWGCSSHVSCSLRLVSSAIFSDCQTVDGRVSPQCGACCALTAASRMHVHDDHQQCCNLQAPCLCLLCLPFFLQGGPRGGVFSVVLDPMSSVWLPTGWARGPTW
jgi:hypothetical protein